MKGRRSRGFTLLEVMLAFVILAAALGLLIGMLSRGLGQVTQSQGETQATLHAQSLLEDVGVLEPIAVGVREGEFDRGRYRYRIEVTEVADPAPAPATAAAAGLAGSAQTTTVNAPVFYRIGLLVSWGEAGPAQRLQFVTLRARAVSPLEPSP